MPVCPSSAGRGCSSPFLSSNTQSAEVGAPWPRGGRRLGKKQRRGLIPSDCTQQEVCLSLWESWTQESVYQAHGAPPRPQVPNPHLPQVCTDYGCAVLCWVAQSCQTLCNPMDCSPPGSSVHGILQAGVLEWLPCPPAGDLPNPGIEPGSATRQADSLLPEPPAKPLLVCTSTQSIYRELQIDWERSENRPLSVRKEKAQTWI